MGVLDEGRAIACMVYHNFDETTQVVEISGAATDRRWLTRPVLHDIFDYPLRQLDLQMVVMQVSASKRQRHLHRILKRIGFRSHTIARLKGRNEDGIVFTLTDDDWRASDFNRMKHHGQKLQSAHAA